MIESIYELTIEDVESQDSTDFIESTQKVNELLNIISTSVDYESISKLDDLIASSQVEAEKQGFKSGFKYAMRLIKECGLK